MAARRGPWGGGAKPGSDLGDLVRQGCDKSSARPRGSCFCWQAELKINDRTSASLRPQDVTNIWGNPGSIARR